MSVEQRAAKLSSQTRFHSVPRTEASSSRSMVETILKLRMADLLRPILRKVDWPPKGDSQNAPTTQRGAGATVIAIGRWNGCVRQAWTGSLQNAHRCFPQPASRRPGSAWNDANSRAINPRAKRWTSSASTTRTPLPSIRSSTAAKARTVPDAVHAGQCRIAQNHSATSNQIRLASTRRDRGQAGTPPSPPPTKKPPAPAHSPHP